MRIFLGESGEYTYTPPSLIAIVNGTSISGPFINNLSWSKMNLAPLKDIADEIEIKLKGTFGM